MHCTEIQRQILSALQNSGILIDTYTPQTRLREVIGDSLALVTFEIELEQSVGIQIPADMFTVDWMEHTFEELEALVAQCR